MAFKLKPVNAADLNHLMDAAGVSENAGKRGTLITAQMKPN